MRSLASPLLVALALTLPSVLAAQIPWSDPRWRIEAAESVIEEYRGRSALRLTNGTAWLTGADLRDGTIEFDLAVQPTQGFHGVAFRVASAGDFEHFYVRPHQSGNPDATQYTPVFNGRTGWQIYASPQFWQSLVIPADQWMHVRMVIRGNRLEVDVDGELLVFPALLRTPIAGDIGFNAGGAPARFANVIVRPGDVAAMRDSAGAPADSVPAGVVTRWRVSSPFLETRLKPLRELDPAEWRDLEWQPLASGERGIANLAMLQAIDSGRNTVFAAVTLRAERAGPIRARFGFSDRVQVILNGRTLYLGNDLWRSRDYRFLGTIGLHDEVVLPLRAGDNELWFAVSESFGGWGITMQLPDGTVRVIDR